MVPLNNDNLITPVSAITNPFMEKQNEVEKHVKNVVIVDDESTGRMILGKIIQQIDDDIVITQFEHSKEALEWVQNSPPDLIVTDYKMPELNGVQFIQAVRQSPDCENIPIMMITVVSEKAV